jgi:hypothetical protein
MLQVVNTEALSRAAVALVGPQMTDAIAQLYAVIDQAMKDGYELGKLEATEGVEKALDNAFDEGWKYGEAEGKLEALADIEAIACSEWDEGYLAGVSDARGRPSMADQNVSEILSDAAQHAINGEVETPSDGAIYAAVSLNDWEEEALRREAEEQRRRTA